MMIVIVYDRDDVYSSVVNYGKGTVRVHITYLLTTADDVRFLSTTFFQIQIENASFPRL